MTSGCRGPVDLGVASLSALLATADCLVAAYCFGAAGLWLLDAVIGRLDDSYRPVMSETPLLVTSKNSSTRMLEVLRRQWVLYQHIVTQTLHSSSKFQCISGGSLWCYSLPQFFPYGQSIFESTIVSRA